jgi:hypothetical protein
VEDNEGLADIVSVTLDLSEVGGEEDAAMRDDGEEGDEEEGDGVYTAFFQVDPSVSPGKKKLEVVVVDSEGQDDSDKLTVKVVKHNFLPEIGFISFDPAMEAADGVSEVLMEVPVSDGNGLEDIDAVTTDLSEVGGRSSAVLRDDGTKGDVTAGDGTYSILFVVEEGLEEGSKELKVTVSDKSGEEVSETTFFLVLDLGAIIEDMNKAVNDTEDAIDQFMLMLAIGAIMIVILVIVAVAAASSSGKKGDKGGPPGDYDLPPPKRGPGETDISDGPSQV